MLRRFLYIILTIPILFLVWHTMVRMIRYFHKFPIPQFMANLIDNPLRRRLQPPDKMPLRHGIEPGMQVLEVGPGNGRYTLATARLVGESGRVVAIDIEPRMVERVRHRAEAEGVANVDARVADVYDLPFDEGSFDAAYMIAVIGEIPDPDQAMREVHRVLVPGGTLAFSELLMDPDYPRASTLIRKASAAGLRLKHKIGNAFNYTLIFQKTL